MAGSALEYAMYTAARPAKGTSTKFLFSDEQETPDA